MQLDSIEVLKAFKEVYSYRELSNKLPIPTSSLCIYCQGVMIPGLETSRKILDVLLSRDSIRNYLLRVLSKYKWDLGKLLTAPNIINVLSMYIAKVIVDNLAGSGVAYLLSLSNLSAPITALTALRLGLPIRLIYSHKASSEANFVLSTLRKGDYVVIISDMFTYDHLVNVIELINRYELALKLLVSIVLTDKELEKELSKLTVIEYLIP